MAIKRIGKYNVQGQLGKGAQSTILQISRAEDGRQYALKVVPINSAADKKYHEQAEHEFRVAQMLDHPNLVKIHALETQSDWFFRVKKVFLLIEYVPGLTFDRVKSLSLKRLLPLLVQVASAVVHMHRRGVFHADLKPNNIIHNTKTGQAKVIDFGLAWIKGESKGRIQGTPEYMAPETVRSKIVNESSDIYNFGATMYRMVTWQLPPSPVPGATGSISAKTLAALLKPVAECNPSAPKELCDLIHRCLSYKVEQRPERMSEVQGALDRIADDLGAADDDDE